MSILEMTPEEVQAMRRRQRQVKVTVMPADETPLRVMVTPLSADETPLRVMVKVPKEKKPRADDHLTVEQVREIRRRWDHNHAVPRKAAMQEMGVTNANIIRVGRRMTRLDVPEGNE